MLNKVIHRYTLLAVLAVLLSGCGLREQQPAPVEQVNKPHPQKPHPTQPAPTVPNVPVIPVQPGPIEHQDTTGSVPAPKVRNFNWNTTMQPLVVQMMQSGNISSGGVLLVDTVNNRTNGSLQTAPATEALRTALANNGKFTLVSPQQLSMAKQQLGLSPQDSLGTIGKAVGIARITGAQYVLYSNVTGAITSPDVQLQLMLVQSGEMVWSGKGGVQKN